MKNQPYENLIYNPSSLVGRLERSGYIAPYDSVRGLKCKQVTIKFDSGDASWRQKFPYDPELTNATIKAISVINSTEAVSNILYQAPSGDFYGNMATSTMRAAFFVLARGSEQLALLPLVSMVRTENSGKYQFFNSTRHIWGDSYIEITTSGVINPNDVLTFIVYYE